MDTMKTIWFKDGTKIDTKLELYFYSEGIRLGNDITSKKNEFPYTSIDYII
jgi:hypothetical protein